MEAQQEEVAEKIGRVRANADQQEAQNIPIEPTRHVRFADPGVTPRYACVNAATASVGIRESYSSR